MDLLSPRHLLILLVIVLLVFGTKKVKTIGSDLGHAFRGFKTAMKEGEDATSSDEPSTHDARQIPGTEKPAEKTAEKPAERQGEKVAEKSSTTADKATHA